MPFLFNLEIVYVKAGNMYVQSRLLKYYPQWHKDLKDLKDKDLVNHGF